MASKTDFCDQIHDSGIRLVASLPDNWVASAITAIESDDRFTHISTAREAEIVGICSGAFFGGVDSLAVMGMAGVLSIPHEVATLNLMHDIPLLILTSMRGQPDEEPHAVYQVSQGQVGISVLDALGIYHEVIHDWDQFDLSASLKHTRITKRPVVLALTRNLLVDLGKDR